MIDTQPVFLGCRKMKEFVPNLLRKACHFLPPRFYPKQDPIRAKTTLLVSQIGHIQNPTTRKSLTKTQFYSLLILALFLIVTVPFPNPNAKCRPSEVQEQAFILAETLCLSTLFFSEEEIKSY